MSASATEDVIEQIVRNLDARIRNLLNAEPKLQAWQAPTLINSWANLGGSFNPAGYWKDLHGVVHLRGVITGGANLTVAFTLPANYRPQFTNAFYQIGTDEVQVQADGDVFITATTSGAGNAFLDGITFRAFQ